MKNYKSISVASALFVSILTGCQTTGDEYAADVFDTSQLNGKQETKTVNIISVMPAKVAVNNTGNKKTAQLAGTTLGAIAGGVIGYALGSGSDLATGGGAVGGGVVGAVSGSAVADKVMHEGVSLTYKDGVKVYTSVQLGKACQFTTGLAVVIATKVDETRIQPNAACPVKK